MKKIAIITDTSGIFQNVKIDNVFVTPIKILASKNYETLTFDDEVDITRDQIFTYLNEGYSVSTAQPSVNDVIILTEKLLKKYSAVVFAVISKNMSGFYNILRIVQEEFGYKKVHIIDTLQIGVPLTWLIMDLRKMLDDGKSFEELDEYTANYQKRVSATIIIKNVKQMVKSGRVSGVKALLIRIFKIKLIIKLEDGKWQYFDKSDSYDATINRSLKCIDRIISFKSKGIKRIEIMSDLHNPSQEALCIANIKKFIGDDSEIKMSKLPNSVIAHGGNDTFTIAIEAKE